MTSKKEVSTSHRACHVMLTNACCLHKKICMVVSNALLPSPLRVVPHPLSFPGGGWGTVYRHLVNPKFFVAAHCVVVWVAVL